MLPLHDTSAGSPAGVGQRAAQPEPVVHRHVVLGDGDEAGQPRLGREQIVVRAVERVGAALVPDGEQLPLGVEQEAEVHLHRVVVGAVGDRLQARHQLGRRSAIASASSRSVANEPVPRWPSSPGRVYARDQPAGSRRSTPTPGSRCRSGRARPRRQRGPRPPERLGHPRERIAPRPARAAPSRSATRREPQRTSERRDGAGASDRPAAHRPAPAPASSARQIRPSKHRLVDRCRRHACRSAIRWPARLPLSTVETYGRLQHAQIVQVVPVVEVAAEPAHPLERAERQLEPLGHLLER